MGKKSFDPRECIGPLNNVKQAMQMSGRPFSKESMINGLKGCGLPVNTIFWSVFRKSGILQEVSKGRFMFTSKDPIYIGVLNTIKVRYRELANRYNDNKKKSEVLTKEETEPKESSERKCTESDYKTAIQSAINLLKERGYLIFSPV